MESSLNNSHSSASAHQITNPFKDLNETTFLDPSLSEDQLLAIIEEEANRGCRSPHEVLQLIEENSFVDRTQQYSNQEDPSVLQNDSIGKPMALPPVSNLLSSNSFSAITAQLDQSNYAQNFSNFANQNGYLPYLPMNLYQQMLVEQATQNHMIFVNNLNTPSSAPLNYNQNLDSYIEAVFDDNPPKNSYYSDFNSKERQQNIQHEIVTIQSQTEAQSQNESKQKGEPLFQPKENIHQNRIECDDRLYQIQQQKSDLSNLALISVNQNDTEISNKNILMPISQNDFNSYYSRTPQKSLKSIDIDMRQGKSVFHPYINRRGGFKKIENNQKNLYLMPNTVNENFTNNPFQYIVPPLNEVPVQSPLQTKQSYILTSNSTLPSSEMQVEMLENNFQKQTFIVQQEDYFSKLNYLDTSDIVITRIKTPEEPLHKKRKQQLEILKNCEITFEEQDTNDLIASSIREPENDEIDEEIPLSKLRINRDDYLKAFFKRKNKLHSIAEQNTEFECLKNSNGMEFSNINYDNHKKFIESSQIFNEEKPSILLRSTKPDTEISLLNKLQQKQTESREIGKEIVKLGNKIINNNTIELYLENERSFLPVKKTVSSVDPKNCAKRNRKNKKRIPSQDNQVKDKFSEKEKTVMKKKNSKLSLPSDEDKKGIHVINILKRKMEINHLINENRKRTRLQIKRQIESESQQSDSKRKK